MYHSAVCGRSLQRNRERIKDCASKSHGIDYGNHHHYCPANIDSARDHDYDNHGDHNYRASGHDRRNLYSDRIHHYNNRTDYSNGHDCSADNDCCSRSYRRSCDHDCSCTYRTPQRSDERGLYLLHRLWMGVQRGRWRLR